MGKKNDRIASGTDELAGTQSSSRSYSSSAGGNASLIVSSSGASAKEGKTDRNEDEESSETEWKRQRRLRPRLGVNSRGISMSDNEGFVNAEFTTGGIDVDVYDCLDGEETGLHLKVELPVKGTKYGITGSQVDGEALFQSLSIRHSHSHDDVSDLRHSLDDLNDNKKTGYFRDLNDDIVGLPSRAPFPGPPDKAGRQRSSSFDNSTLNRERSLPSPLPTPFPLPLPLPVPVPVPVAMHADPGENEDHDYEHQHDLPPHLRERQTQSSFLERPTDPPPKSYMSSFVSDVAVADEEEDELRALGEAAFGVATIAQLPPTPEIASATTSVAAVAKLMGSSVDGACASVVDTVAAIHGGEILPVLPVDGQDSTGSAGAEALAAALVEDASKWNSSILDEERDRAILALLDKTGRMHCKMKKKLVLSNLNMSASDVPVDAICARPLGDWLHKLNLAGNRLLTVPDRLVGGELKGLHTLDLQQCDLTVLPTKWTLPSLRRLILSHNRLEEFMDENMLRGLPELKHLDMYDNKLCDVTLPTKKGILSKLEYLNLGFNNLVCLPEDLPQRLRKLRVLKVTHNLITHIPKKVVCDMDSLKELEVTPNPLIQPPIEDCERGLCGMRRYYRCIAMKLPPSVSHDHHRQDRGGSGAEFFAQLHHDDDADSWGADSRGTAGSAAATPIQTIRKTLKEVKKLKAKRRTMAGGAPFSTEKEASSGIGKIKKTLQSKLHNLHNTYYGRSKSNASAGELASMSPLGRHKSEPHMTTDSGTASSSSISLFPNIVADETERDISSPSKPPSSETSVRVQPSSTVGAERAVEDAFEPKPRTGADRPKNPQVEEGQGRAAQSVVSKMLRVDRGGATSFAAGRGEWIPEDMGATDMDSGALVLPMSSSKVSRRSVMFEDDSIAGSSLAPTKRNVIIDRDMHRALGETPRARSEPLITLSGLGVDKERYALNDAFAHRKVLSSTKEEDDEGVRAAEEKVLRKQEDGAFVIEASVLPQTGDAFALSKAPTGKSIETAAATTVKSVVVDKQQSVVTDVPEKVRDEFVVEDEEDGKEEQFAVNDTLKVIFVGMAYTGKTSIIRRLKNGGNAPIPKREERTIGVDIYEWDPKKHASVQELDTRVKREVGGDVGGEADGEDDPRDVNVKFSVWDFAGQNVYHATHELFFSPRALYVLVWDMAVNNPEVIRRRTSLDEEADAGPFGLSDDSSVEGDDENVPFEQGNLNGNDYATDQEARRAERALERDVDYKVQFWIDCIQSCVPGAAILPVASFDDHFQNGGGGEVGATCNRSGTCAGGAGGSNGGIEEARRRCEVMKRRLLQHEERRKAGLGQRLEQLRKGRRANTEVASRLRKLLCPFMRPKLIFCSDDECAASGECSTVLRVSSTAYTGFDQLRNRIVNIATGREHGGFSYPIFRGHVGAVIPRMRLKVRDVVRSKRKELKVVEWGHFLTILQKSLTEDELKNVDDVIDALHFLSNIGEISYFGGRDRIRHEPLGYSLDGEYDDDYEDYDDDEDEDEEEQEHRILAIDNYDHDPYCQYIEESNTSNGGTGKGEKFHSSLSWHERKHALRSFPSKGRELSGLSDFVFLNPRWLVAVVACILRHDLRQEIDETRRMMALRHDFEITGDWQNSGRGHGHGPGTSGGGFSEANLNCPIITAEEACMLWKTKKVIVKAAERAKNESSSSTTLTAFEFLQRLLVRFHVFVPIDLNIDKALFGGEEYDIDEGPCNSQDGEVADVIIPSPAEGSKFFFLPSLVGPGEPSSDTWTYKCQESWRTTLCVSWCFPDGVPPGLMERLTAIVLRDVYAVTQDGTSHGPVRKLPQADNMDNSSNSVNMDFGDSVGGKLRVHEILCWRTAFLLTIGMEMDYGNIERRESIVEIFAHLVDQDSPMCVAADFMSVGTRRLAVSAKGQEGDGGKKIWKGGYEIVTKAVERVVREYGGLEFEKEGVCPECLASLRVNQASVWNWTQVRYAAKRGNGKMRCRMGHLVDNRLIGGFRSCGSLENGGTGTNFSIGPPNKDYEPLRRFITEERETSTGSSHASVLVKDLIGSVVLIGLWDSKQNQVTRAGTGFVVDRKRGLIVTASHTLMDMSSGSAVFGEDYYGQSSGKAVVGVIPESNQQGNGAGAAALRTTAVFRYFAKIVSKDPCNMDACVLKIVTKLEKDVGGQGTGCGDVAEIPLLGKKELKKEGLKELKVTKTCEIEERIRILGFNQGGEGLVEAGYHLNRVADLAEGYVSKIFEAAETPSSNNTSIISRKELRPRAEIVTICPTIGGHSGGPCVNQEGEVIGILSRADPADRQRCYLVPASEFVKLVKEAKHHHPVDPKNELMLMS